MDTQVLANQQGHAHQLGADTGCILEDLPGAIDDRDGWRERESGNNVLLVQLYYFKLRDNL